MTFFLVSIKRGILITCVLLLCVYQGTSEPLFMVTFPGIIRSGSEAKLCVSLLKPEENLQLTISLVDNSQNRTLLQERIEKEFHRCLDFQAPESNSVQVIQVEAQGKKTHLIEKRKVKFVSYNPVTIIRTDKQIYNPGQTVQFRIFTVDQNLKPVNETYKLIAVQDNRRNRINQWINATSTHGKILQLSHVLNPEASVGLYELSVETSKTTIKEKFQVKEYVLPKFEVILEKAKTVKANKQEVNLRVCGRYTHGRPVEGSVKMGLCSPLPISYFFYSYYNPQYKTPRCVNSSAILNETGCVSQKFPMSVFVRKSENYMYNLPQFLTFTASVTEEGTDISMERTENVFLSYNIGSLKFIDLPEFFEDGSVIQAKVKVEFSDGTPVSNFKIVVHHTFQHSTFTPQQHQELITDISGMANFTIDTSIAISAPLSVSAYPSPGNQLGPPFYFESVYKTLQIKPKGSPTKMSQLAIKDLEEPLKCDMEIPITVQYTIAGETVESGYVTIVYLVLSRKEIVHHGYENVEVKGADGVVEGEVMFKVLVRTKMAPKMEFLAYCVPPSEIVLAVSRTFQIEKCLENKVSLQFSPTTAVPGEENTLQLSALPGSLCSLSAVDQSVLILEKNKRLDIDKVFSMLPADSFFSFDIEDQEECFNIRSIRSPQSARPSIQSYPLLITYPSQSKEDAVYEAFRNMGLKVATNLIIKMPSCIIFRDAFYLRAYGGGYGPIGLHPGMGVFPGYGYPASARIGVPGPIGPVGVGVGGVGGIGEAGGIPERIPGETERVMRGQGCAYDPYESRNYLKGLKVSWNAQHYSVC